MVEKGNVSRAFEYIESRNGKEQLAPCDEEIVAEILTLLAGKEYMSATRAIEILIDAATVVPMVSKLTLP